MDRLAARGRDMARTAAGKGRGGPLQPAVVTPVLGTGGGVMAAVALARTGLPVWAVVVLAVAPMILGPLFAIVIQELASRYALRSQREHRETLTAVLRSPSRHAVTVSWPDGSELAITPAEGSEEQAVPHHPVARIPEVPPIRPGLSSRPGSRGAPGPGRGRRRAPR
jgi:hypothetical protein